MSVLENLLIFKFLDVAYNAGSPLVNGSRYKLPNGISNFNIRHYLIAMRDMGNTVKYVSLFGSSNLDTNVHNFDGNVFNYTSSTNTLTVIKNTTIINISLIRFLTYPI